MFIVFVAYRRAHTDLKTHHHSHDSQRASPVRPVCLCLFCGCVFLFSFIFFLFFFFSVVSSFVLSSSLLPSLFLFFCLCFFGVCSFVLLLSCLFVYMVLLRGLSLDSSFVRVHSEFLNSYAFIDVLLMLCFNHFGALFRVLHAALRYLQCLQVHLRFTRSRIFLSAVMTSFPM